MDTINSQCDSLDRFLKEKELSSVSNVKSHNSLFLLEHFSESSSLISQLLGNPWRPQAGTQTLTRQGQHALAAQETDQLKETNRGDTKAAHFGSFVTAVRMTAVDENEDLLGVK